MDTGRVDRTRDRCGAESLGRRAGAFHLSYTNLELWGTGNYRTATPDLDIKGAMWMSYPSYWDNWRGGGLDNWVFAQDNGDGTFTTDPASPPTFAPIDLYMMGLIEATAVPAMFYIEPTDARPHETIM